jgi:hypothetical protein
MEGSESFDKLRMSGENKLKVKNLKPKAKNVMRLPRSFASLEDDRNGEVGSSTSSGKNTKNQNTKDKN